VSAGLGRRKEEENTLKAARRSMAIVEEESVAQSGGSLTRVPIIIPAANGTALPHQVTLPHACSSFPRSLPPGKCLGRPVAPFRCCQATRALWLSHGVAWPERDTLGHGGGTVSIALSDHGHLASIKWTRHPRNTLHPLILLTPPRDQNGSG